jgi:hypothetical protein
MLEDFCRIGCGKIYRYRLGERVVAVDLCIESAGVHVLLKTTYDESIKGLSPSSLLRQEAYRRVFNEGRIRRIEFYGPVMQWTTRWTDLRRRLFHVNVWRYGLAPALVSGVRGLSARLERGRLANSAG